MNRTQAITRWLAAAVCVVVLGVVWYIGFGRRLNAPDPAVGATQRRIDTVVDLGDDGSTRCEHPEIERGVPAPSGALRVGSTACILLASVDAARSVRWFFFGRATGGGLIRVPRPVQVGRSLVALSNGAVVPIGPSVAVRCSPDPNERFESWISRGLTTAGYVDSTGALVAIDCASE